MRLWNADTGEEVASRFATDTVRKVAFTADGELLAVEVSDETFRVWTTRTGESVMTLLTGHISPASIAFSPEGFRIAACGQGWVRLWDIKTGRPICAPLTPHSGYVNDVAFSPDGSFVVTAGTDATLRFWPASADPAGLCADLMT